MKDCKSVFGNSTEYKVLNECLTSGLPDLFRVKKTFRLYVNQEVRTFSDFSV
ncbi:MAG: hypothetical protein NZO16_01980 [Deltaproteobacteria bacterium]|nr:hypothetical protein [Deltaproteobacteria bacterium]